MFKKLLTICAFLILVGCAGEANETCLPSNSTITTASGVEQNAAAKIFEYLKQKKIITSILATIKQDVIGTSGGGGAAKSMFVSITSNSSFKSALNAAFTLAILFYGVGVATGIIQTQLGDALIRMGKIIVIAVIATNWNYFYGVIGSFFINGTDELMFYMMENFKDLYIQGPSGAKGTIDSLFSDLDVFFVQIFSIHTFAILAALISPNGGNAGPYSNIYAIFLFFSMYQVMTGLLRVVAIYAFSLFARALLLALAPIFFVFLLFGQTKSIFDAWVKTMISYSIQPVIVSAFLGLFISALSSLFKEVYVLKVCFQTPSTEHPNGWHFVDAKNDPLPTSVNSSAPISLESVLMLFFFSWMFSTYLKLAEAFGSAIAQSQTGALGAALPKIFNGK